MSTSVLIIDGDPTFAENAQEALEAAGHTVHVRFDASLEDVRTLRPRVLMLSAELPRGSGFGVCSRIRRDKTLRETAIFMMTAEADHQALVRHARSAEPANDYARKDIPMQELVDRVARLLGQVPTLTLADPQRVVTDPMVTLPPPLPRTDSTSVETAPSVPTSGTAQLLELWPKDDFNTEFRQALASTDADPGPKSRATPEQRLTHLRLLVKQHETRLKTVRQLWDQVIGRGQELAGRIVTITAELADARSDIETAREKNAEAVQQRETVQKEFHTFEEEIRRIFSEKDREEQALQAELRKLKAEQAELTAAVQAGDEQRRDDERRLTFLQEELDAQTVEKERTAEQATAQAANHEAIRVATEKQLRELTARLETAEHIAAERGEAIESLRDQLDQLTIDSDQARANLSAGHDRALEEIRKKHDDELAAAENAHRAQIGELGQRYDRLIGELEDQLRNTVEDKDAKRQSEVSSLTEEHARRTQDLMAAHDGVVARLTSERDDLHAEINGLQTALADSERRIADQSARLQDERRKAVEQTAHLKSQFEGFEARASEQIRQLHTRLQEADGALQATRTELEEERSAHGVLADEHGKLQLEFTDAQATIADFEAQIAAATTRADAAEAKVSERTERLGTLESSQGRLEIRLKDAESRLDAARRRLVDADETARAHRSEIVALRAKNEQQKDEVEEARSVQADLEAQVEKLARDRSELQEALDDLNTRHAELDRVGEAARGRLAELEGHLANAEARADQTANLQRGLVQDVAQRDNALSALQGRFAQAVEALRVAKLNRAESEQQLRTVLAEQKAQTERASTQEEQLNESRFAMESIRNALEALGRDLVYERRAATSPRVMALLDRIERVAHMSIEALSDGDGRDANVTDDDLPIFEGAAPVSDSDALTNPFGPLDEVPILGDEPMTQLRAGGSALAFEEALPTDAGAALPSLLEPIGLKNGDEDDELHVTEIIDLSRAD